MTRSLPMQMAAITHCIAVARHAGVEETIAANADCGVESLAWCDRNADIIKEVVRLMTESPAVIAFLRAFKGAEIRHPDEVSNAFGRTTSEGAEGSEDRRGLGRPSCEVQDHTEPSTTDGGLI